MQKMFAKPAFWFFIAAVVVVGVIMYNSKKEDTKDTKDTNAAATK